MRKHLAITGAVAAAALIGGVIVVGVARAGDDERAEDRQGTFQQTNLVSNIQGLAAVQDPHVKNPWGMASVPGGPLWVANNNGQASTVYTLANDVPKIQPLVVTLAAQDSPTTWAPTGLVANVNPMLFMFQGDLHTDVSAAFIFASEDGRIVAWNPKANQDPTIASTVVNTPDAVYKGLAFGTNDEGSFIFATNFHAGTVEAFDTKFQPVRKLKFTDRDVPAGYAPFGIANIEGNLFVSFALQDQDKHDDVAGAGHGFVDVFTTSGKLVRRLVQHGALNSPWGMTRAPLAFSEKFGGAILVGNFGDGRINAFDNRGNFLGTLRGKNNQAIVINGLWSLMFGAFTGADPDELYFTAGVNREADGLIGELAPVSRKH